MTGPHGDQRDDRDPAGSRARQHQETARRHARLLEVVALLGEGEVTTYGDVAEVAGQPGRARLVGRLLSTEGGELPWWRVVTASGRLVPGNEPEQARLLRAEGVIVRSGRVVAAPIGRFRRRRGECPGDQSSPTD